MKSDLKGEKKDEELRESLCDMSQQYIPKERDALKRERSVAAAAALQLHLSKGKTGIDLASRSSNLERFAFDVETKHHKILYY